MFPSNEDYHTRGHTSYCPHCKKLVDPYVNYHHFETLHHVRKMNQSQQGERSSPLTDMVRIDLMDTEVEELLKKMTNRELEEALAKIVERLGCDDNFS
jgi:hypothetical protein